MVATAQQVDFRPLHDWVLFEEIPRGVSPGGVVIPDTVRTDDLDKARVVAVGPGRVTDSGEVIEPNVKPGDIVYIFFAYSKPALIKLDGKPYGLTRCQDIVATASKA